MQKLFLCVCESLSLFSKCNLNTSCFISEKNYFPALVTCQNKQIRPEKLSQLPSVLQWVSRLLKWERAEEKKIIEGNTRPHQITPATARRDPHVNMTPCLCFWINISRPSSHTGCRSESTAQLHCWLYKHGSVYMWEAGSWIVPWDTGFTLNVWWDVLLWDCGELTFREVGWSRATDAPASFARCLIVPRRFGFVDSFDFVVFCFAAQNSRANLCNVIMRWCECSGRVAPSIFHRRHPEYRGMDWSDGTSHPNT